MEQITEKTTTFRRLPEYFRMNTYDYALIKRVGDVCIYKQYDKKVGEDIFHTYEVFEVRKRPASILRGIEYPAHEKTPSNEQWGTNAFTVNTIDAAEKYFKQIEDNITKRKTQQNEH